VARPRYGPRVQPPGESIEKSLPPQRVPVPDVWQEQAVSALRAGKDVVVHAPTGAGKTLIFELWSDQGRNQGQAIYTVPTRALANDKLAEWRSRGWDVGIATGDLSDNLEAPVVIATLETQKNRLIRGDGPSLLIIDEYQMLGDPDRGLNYELAIAMAPAKTQLLLLSGSVENPHHIVKWLTRLGRKAVIVRHEERPVPLAEADLKDIDLNLPSEIRGIWPRNIAKALASGLGPVLLFAPQRKATEMLAAELTRFLPNPNPLILTPEQKAAVGENLARMLRSRITYHHSGLSYAARAGVIEPLAKAGQLRVVVATMGLAAGINFSLRSVALAAATYRRDNVEHPIKPDEILQMFGRAGRRGLDKSGFVLVTENNIRLQDGRPAWLSRSGMVDWNALLGIMHAAAAQNRLPFLAAVEVQERLFTTKPIVLGVEESLKHPNTPCGLETDAERARHVRRREKELLNSQGEWERMGQLVEVPLKEIKAIRDPKSRKRDADAPEEAIQSEAADRTTGIQLVPALSVPGALDRIGQGQLVRVGETDGHRIYGRSSVVADRLNDDQVIMAKWVQSAVGWNGRQATLEQWNEKIVRSLAEYLAHQGTPLVEVVEDGLRLLALTSLAEHKLRVPVDRHGVALHRPKTRDVMPTDCGACPLVETCRKLPSAIGAALLWRRMGLVDAKGVPTLRGRVVSFFHQGDGLAAASALEDEHYPLGELIYDLANLNAGFRFCGGKEARFEGRLARSCQRLFGNQNIPGYLENGLPPGYGFGAQDVVKGVHGNPVSKQRWITPWTGPGDIDRVIIEWRSLMRQITNSPNLEWSRWTGLKALAKTILNETESPSLVDLPPLESHQTERVDHKLHLRHR
jgi:hypothetical protein